MNVEHKMISLGFTADKVPAGTHICQIFSDDDDRNESLLKFLLSGFKEGERVACFSEKADETVIGSFLKDNGLSLDDLLQKEAFALAGTSDEYFKENTFDPDRMLDSLSLFHKQSSEMGFTGSRVIGEMTPEVQQIAGGERLLEYEARISLLLREHPITAVCQYDAHSFDGAVIMDILKVHPLMIVRGAVVKNPFFIPPEEFLS